MNIAFTDVFDLNPHPTDTLIRWHINLIRSEGYRPQFESRTY